jgi:hypothetical protein
METYELDVARGARQVSYASKEAKRGVTAEGIFSIANMVALLAWLGILLMPRAPIVTELIVPILIPCLFAVAYIIIIARFFDPAGFANFSSLDGLASLQGSPWLLLAGWLHYLAFDLFVGTWEVRTARADGIPHLAIVPSPVLTFMFGPAGLLLFVMTRYGFRRRLSARA